VPFSVMNTASSAPLGAFVGFHWHAAHPEHDQQSAMCCDNRQSQPRSDSSIISVAHVATSYQAQSSLAYLNPDPGTIPNAYNNTPFSIAASRRHDAPLMMEVLNPATVIRDLQRMYGPVFFHPVPILDWLSYVELVLQSLCNLQYLYPKVSTGCLSCIVRALLPLAFTLLHCSCILRCTSCCSC
jgi:ankyrin repeat protein